MKPLSKHNVTKAARQSFAKQSLIVIISFFLFSCKTMPQKESVSKVSIKPVSISRNLMAQGQLTQDQLAYFFWQNNPDIEYEQLYEFAGIYINEAGYEGINSDFAWAQMCLETGFLRFGGLVQPEWHNYCGLGAISAEQPGCIFESAELGVRAHIQHIQAYATTEEVQLHKELVDPRYSWVHKTKYAQTIQELAESWATDPEYALKLENLLTRMEESTK